MGAPTPTARGTPSGIKLPDGFRCLHTFSHNPTIGVWEIEVTPIGDDNGEPINTTTQHNTQFRTKAPRSLNEGTDGTVKFAYDPTARTALRDEIGRAQAMTTRFADGSTEAWYGYLRSVTYDPMVEGTMPTGTAILTPTHYDPTNKVEAGPVVSGVAGT